MGWLTRLRDTLQPPARIADADWDALIGSSALFARMKGHLVNVERAMGVLMVITGIGFLTGAVSSVSIWLLETFPVFGSIG